MNPLESPAYLEWLQTRPECVRQLAIEFPLHTEITSVSHRSEPRLYVIGWTENDMLIVSPLRLDEDYATAMLFKAYVHADCAREPKPIVVDT